MPMRRENVAAALKYLQDKADLRGRAERALSLDPQEQDLADIAVETGASLIPGVGQALAARDVERARRANDPAGMAMASMGAIPGGRLAKLLKGFDPTRLELDVYHGTPHRFPATEANPLGEFDASKIGTGEGGSVYGKGTYFSASPKFAKEFARHVGEPRLSLNGQELERGTPDYEAAMLVDSMGLEEAQKYVKRATTDESEKVSGHFKTVDAALANITKKSDVKNLGLGQIYKADLPDEMIDRMLDYNKPINKHSRNVLDALEKAGINTQSAMPAGQMVYGQEAHLAKFGIPGMIYREGQGKGPRNFVVFPGEEKKVRILERDGQKAPPQKIAQALEAAPDYRMTHRPMSDAGGASRLHNAYESFGEDIYGPKALQYFGAGDPREAKVVAALKRLRDNPDAEVTIYRGVPKDATGEIGKGDWVTLDRSVAAEYGDKVLTKKVKAKDITTWPDSLLEFGYYPEN